MALSLYCWKISSASLSGREGEGPKRKDPARRQQEGSSSPRRGRQEGLTYRGEGWHYPATGYGLTEAFSRASTMTAPEKKTERWLM